MPRDHHFAFAKRVLPGQAFAAPDRVFAELAGPMREPFLMFLWNEAGKGASHPLPHVGNAVRSPGGFPETIALDVVRVGVVGQTEIVVVQMPPALEPNEAWFVALTRTAGQVRVFTYERSAQADLVLAEIRPDGRANFGFHADPSVAGFLHALGGALGFPLVGLAPPVGGLPEVARRTLGAPPEKKGPLVPIAVAVTLLLPGMILFSFALGEARSFGSDWVLLATPLLLLSAASLAWGLGRKLGPAGYLTGAVVGLGGLVTAFAILSGRIDERLAHWESYQALKDTQAFCDGRGKPDRRARPYRAKGPNPTVVYERLAPGSRAFQSSYDAAFRSWEPPRHHIDKTALVACVERVDTEVETCRYEQGASIVRKASALKISLYAIADGEKVFETTLDGGQPRACSISEKFYGSSKQHHIYGEVPPMAEVKKALAPHVEGRGGTTASR